MSLPKLACICCTYARPQLLPHALQSYLMQDYPADRCEMIILDDAGQYVSQSHAEPKPWHLVSVSKRFRTLGEKRNASAALASADVDAYVVWDDDDIYLPWTLKAHAAALEKASWSFPSTVLVENAITQALKTHEAKSLFHPAWAFSREAFRAVSGYPFQQSGQDQGLARRFRRAKIPRANPIQLGFDPYFVYRWGSSGSWHLSAMDVREGYDRLAKQRHKGRPIERILPSWPVDYSRAAAGQATPKLELDSAF